GGVGLAFTGADDLDQVVEDVEGEREAFERVNAPLELAQLVRQALRHDFEPEMQEMPEYLLETEPLGPADLGVVGRDEAGQVDVEVRLQQRVLEEERH